MLKYQLDSSHVPARRQRAAKRLLDVAVAILVLMVTGPVLIAVAIAIKIADGGPIFHRRRVLGLKGIEFDALKLRTMRIDANAWLSSQTQLLDEYRSSFKLKADPRVTRVGRILRKYSIDELPQLFNVIVGQMSIVGPRMIHPPELERFGSLASRILDVRPGITGLWQISGRQDLSFDERLRLDAKYLDERSLWGDVWIIVQTVPAVLTGRGAY